MIIFRYLAREVFTAMLAVSGVLLLIIMSGRFNKYLAQAASGQLSADFLFVIMGYRLPEFLELIIPLGLFIGILLAYGRLYIESEMTVLTACGVSQTNILTQTLAPAAVVACIVALLGLVVTPWGAKNVEEIFAKQDALTEFETLAPGRFQEQENAGRVTYTERLSEDRLQMGDVFISQKNGAIGKRGITLLLADGGVQHVEPQTGARYLILNKGYRYDGTPGQADFRITEYDTYGIKMPESKASKETDKVKAIATSELIGSSELSHVAELQWRLSLPVLVFIVVLLAVPLSKVNPRQGRYLKLLPAILTYLVYLALLIGAKGAVEDGKIPPAGLWGVHGLFLLVAMLILAYEPFQMKRRQQKQLKQAAVASEVAEDE
ncbi:LPS export ABC transporter permease LptF [Spartinivicinus poritis]|uniref:Lipopolysaccharide export system permease protein LptF n=1 Tax=Spartinivicinus poritis TaxID=2994640 RepID=A0ABT5U502_9GAMM|nr:LPS export ABC transporter permease LptF [Spartinivicinus sp. A2-2]MDE1460632.1 LPS export ABC transporter permease LptF [Spartinivicinus sp. A2-2]